MISRRTLRPCRSSWHASRRLFQRTQSNPVQSILPSCHPAFRGRPPLHLLEDDAGACCARFLDAARRRRLQRRNQHPVNRRFAHEQSVFPPASCLANWRGLRGFGMHLAWHRVRHSVSPPWTTQTQVGSSARRLLDEAFPIPHVLNERLTEPLFCEVFGSEWRSSGTVVRVACMRCPVGMPYASSGNANQV